MAIQHERLIARFSDFFDTLFAFFYGLKVSKTKFSIDDLDVADWIDRTCNMSDVRILEATNNLSNGVYLTDVAKEFVT